MQGQPELCGCCVAPGGPQAEGWQEGVRWGGDSLWLGRQGPWWAAWADEWVQCGRSAELRAPLYCLESGRWQCGWEPAGQGLSYTLSPTVLESSPCSQPCTPLQWLSPAGHSLFPSIAPSFHPSLLRTSSRSTKTSGARDVALVCTFPPCPSCLAGRGLR